MFINKNLLKTSFWIDKLKKKFNLINSHIGSYKSWSEAYTHSKTYQDYDTIQQIKKAALTAKKNNKYFRDGIVFEKYEYSSELNSLIFLTLMKKKNLGIQGPLKILDLGGGGGSQQMQFQHYCENFGIICDYNWNIVEQDELADFGKKELENRYLKFFRFKDYNFTRDSENSTDIVVFGSVLHILENPYKIISKVIDNNSYYIYVDRTPFWKGKIDVLTILKANKLIPSSYPCWIFSFENFINNFNNNYIVKNVFNSLEGHFFFSKMRNGTHLGLILEKKYEKN